MALTRFLLAVAATLVLSACGSSNNSGTTPLPPSDTRLNTDGSAATRGRPASCSSGRSVYVAWFDQRTGQGDIRFNRSTDGGASWLGQDKRINTDGEGAASRGDPVMACNGGTIYVAWEDARNGGSEIYFNVSRDGGVTWKTEDRRLTPGQVGAGVAVQPALCAVSNSVYCTWADGSVIRIRASMDRGDSFGPVWRVDRESGPKANPTICCAEPQYVFVAWEVLRNGRTDIWFSRTANGGSVWDEDQPVNLGVLGAGQSREPRLCCDLPLVYCVWREASSAGETVFFNAAENYGSFWRPQSLTLDGASSSSPTSSRDHDIACGTSYVYVTWVDDRDGDNFHDAFFRSSDDGGQTFRDVLRIDDEVGEGRESEGTRVCAGGPSVFVLWSEAVPGAQGPSALGDIFVRQSTDRGRSFLGTTRVNTNDPGSSRSAAPSLTCNGDGVFGAWFDSRGSGGTATGSIYFRGATR